MSLPTKTQQYELGEIKTYRNIRLTEAPVGPVKSHSVLVKIHAVSLQYRDLGASIGFYPVAKKGCVPCSDMAGEVLAVGDEVKDWKKGDRVCSNFATEHIYGDPTPKSVESSLGGQSPGVLTQYRTFPDHALVKVPDHLSYEQASTLPCAALTAYNGLMGPTPMKAGDVVVVQGTGGVSMFALQFAVSSGATVIATSSSDEKLKIAQKHGAKHLINYKSTPDWDKQVQEITNGRGADFIIEVGGPGTLGKSIEATRIGGHISVIGFLHRNVPPTDIIVSTLMKALYIRGIYIGSVAQFKDMVRHIEANPSETTPIVDRVFDFKDTIEAYAYLESQKHVGKVVIQVAK